LAERDPQALGDQLVVQFDGAGARAAVLGDIEPYVRPAPPPGS
jgi:hypothetical protein